MYLDPTLNPRLLNLKIRHARIFRRTVSLNERWDPLKSRQIVCLIEKCYGNFPSGIGKENLQCTSCDASPDDHQIGAVPGPVNDLEWVEILSH